MRIVYYTHTAFFEQALSLVRELSRRAEVHLLMELTPGSWQTAAFGARERALPPGLVPADAVLGEGFPEEVRACWTEAASAHLVVHPTVRSIHPTSWRISRDALRFVESLAPDVLHVDDVDVTPRLALALGSLRCVPLVIGTHDPFPHSGERNWRKSLARRLAFRHASRFILHNRRLKPAFCQRYGIDPDRVDVATLGVSDFARAWAEEPAAEQPATLLFFGRISPYKGLDVLYRAMPLVAARVPEVRLVVAGRPIDGYSPPPPPDLPAPASVTLLDRYVANAELARLLQEAAVVVCPYRDATQSAVVLTAYAFGKPVVASRVGGLPDYVEDGETGLLVPPDDPGALAEALVALLRDPGLRARLQEGIRSARATRLHWGRTAEDVLAAYRRLPGRAG